MGNVHAAAPDPPLQTPGAGIQVPPPPTDQQPTGPPEMPEEPKPGPFEDLHKLTKGIITSNSEN